MVEIDYILAGICILLSFFVTLFLTKFWIRVAKKIGLTGKDMNKVDSRQIPEAGGIAVIFGFVFGLFTYIFFKIFYLNSQTHLILVFATICSVLLACFLGFIDNILGWKKGLRQWQKPLLTLPIAIPLMIINAGHSTLSIPLLGPVDFGLLYPLLIVPLGIVGAANGFNILAGFNGLEAGMGAVILSFLGIVAWFHQLPWITLIAFCAVMALLGFLAFNWYPARVFPGDALTYAIGTLIAILAILGSMEKLAIILFIPYFIELVFDLKTKFKKECWGTPQKDGSLKPPEKATSLAHVLMKFFKTEKSIVAALLSIEVLLGVGALAIFYL